MKLLLVLSTLLLSVVGAPAHNYLTAQFLKELAAGPQNHYAAAKLTCIMIFCHFEDKNGCKEQCGEFAKVVDMTKNKPDANMKTEKDCVESCVFKVSGDGTTMCSSLCATYFSYPNTEQYEKDIRVTSEQISAL